MAAKRERSEEDTTNHPPKPKVIKGYEVVNGWIHCRKPASKKRRSDNTPSTPSTPTCSVEHSEIYKKSVQHLYHKEKRYTCPDCEAWYSDDTRKIQLTSRHRQRYETEDELKMWDISFSDSD